MLGVPDAMMGEKVGAVVVPLPGSEPDPHEIRAFAKDRIADFKVPQYVCVRGEPLPRNPAARCSNRCCATTFSGATSCARR